MTNISPFSWHLLYCIPRTKIVLHCAFGSISPFCPSIPVLYIPDWVSFRSKIPVLSHTPYRSWDVKPSPYTAHRHFSSSTQCRPWHQFTRMPAILILLCLQYTFRLQSAPWTALLTELLAINLKPEVENGNERSLNTITFTIQRLFFSKELMSVVWCK